MLCWKIRRNIKSSTQSSVFLGLNGKANKLQIAFNASLNIHFLYNICSSPHTSLQYVSLLQCKKYLSTEWLVVRCTCSNFSKWISNYPVRYCVLTFFYPLDAGPPVKYLYLKTFDTKYGKLYLWYIQIYIFMKNDRFYLIFSISLLCSFVLANGNGKTFSCSFAGLIKFSKNFFHSFHFISFLQFEFDER